MSAIKRILYNYNRASIDAITLLQGILKILLDTIFDGEYLIKFVAHIITFRAQIL
jgi:hypothetical protein